VFDVRPENTVDSANGQNGDAPPPSVVRQSGSVGDMVPFLEVEPTGPDSGSPRTGEEPRVAPSWQEAPPIRKAPSNDPSWQEAPPPVRRPTNRPEALPAPAPVRPAEPAVPAIPKETQERPPRPSLPAEAPAEPVQAPPVRVEAEEERDHEPPALPSWPAERPRSRTPWLIGAVVLTVAAASGGIVYWVWHALAHSEDARYRAAIEQFQDKQYGRAETSFGSLATDFPDSQRFAEYQFRQGLAQALRPAYELGKDATESLGELNQFVETRRDSPLLQASKQPIGEAFEQISKNLITEARQATESGADFGRAREKAQQAHQAAKLGNQYRGRSDTSLAEEIAAVEASIGVAEQRQAGKAQLASLDSTPDGIRMAETLIARHGLQNDSEAMAVVNRLKESLRARVTYVPANELAAVGPNESSSRGIVIVARQSGKPVEGSERIEGVVLALARGVLYALDQRDGRFLWATRVGIDTTALPVRVPATETSSETLLVWSSDESTLTARDLATGRPRWRQVFSSPCLGRSVLVGRRAFVATYDGRVHEIEVDTGRLLGWFEVGQALSVGGAHEEGTDLIYMPGDGLCVYILDVKQKKCVGIVQSGHPRSSLRGPPILVRSDRFDPVTREAGQAHYMILNQADGIQGTKLRAFALPVDKAGAALQPEPAVRGWSWFEPFCDGEKIALATDAGVLGLIGINQPRNQDSALFRILSEDPTFGARPEAALPRQTTPTRNQVVHVQDRDFWVLMDGHLHYMKLAMDRAKGLRLIPVWKNETRFGWPLQPAQVDDTGDRLFLVTQAEGNASLASAVNADDGKVLWQTRLGLVWGADPEVLDNRVMAIDRAGALYEFDSNQPLDAVEEWQSAGRLVAPPQPEATGGHLVTAPDGKTVFVFSSTADGMSLEVRRYEPGKDVIFQAYRLRSPRHGAPAVAPGCFLLPLADGSLLRQPFDGKPARSSPWRNARADRHVPGHVLYLSGDEYVTTDGGRGLSRWKWPLDQDAPKLEKTVELEDTILGLTLLTPAKDSDSGRTIVASDAGGSIYALRADDLGTARKWHVKGTVTAGPYVQRGAVGCVVDQRRLVWIDPSREGFWDYAMEGEAIVGRPPLVGDTIVVVDRSGSIVHLEAATGKPKKPAEVLKASAAPAAAPVRFGPDRMLLPMTDGTGLLLEMSNPAADDNK
jgi:outer membrane protein assembly factor BamB